MTSEKACFVISPIGSEGSETRERSDKLFNYVITPAVEEYDYNPIRADHIAEPGIITSQIIEKVVESPLVIADLTNSNANVFYELAVRHAHQKPIIQLIDKSEDIPFDVAGTRTIQIDLSDIESVERSKDEIKNQIETMESNGEDVQNPISVALDLKNLRESTDPEERSMADIMETLSDLRTNVMSIQKSLNNPEELIPPSYFREIEQNLKDEKYSELNSRLNKLERELHILWDNLEEEDVNDELLRSSRDNVQQSLALLKQSLRNPGQKYYPSSKSLDDFGDFDNSS